MFNVGRSMFDVFPFSTDRVRKHIYTAHNCSYKNYDS